MSGHANKTVEIKTSNLIDVALDWAVAKCEGILGIHVVVKPGKTCVYGEIGGIDFPYQPSTDWSQGGPIIELEKIDIEHTNWVPILCYAKKLGEEYSRYDGPTPLIAAMRCYVASKLGDTVKIPKRFIT